jgi:hypothetical protein
MPRAFAFAVTGVLPSRPLQAMALALSLGGASLVSPQLALLGLALLGAAALMRATSFDAPSLAGPLLAALTLGACVGLAGAIGVIFVWRLFADARWSLDHAARLAQSAGRPAEASLRARAHAWTTPIHGLALVAYSAPHQIAGMPLDLPHVPLWAPLLTGAAALAAVFDWAMRRAAQWRLGELAAAPAAHLLIHHALFLLAYGLTLDVSAGIVAMAAWRLAHAGWLSRA